MANENLAALEVLNNSRMLHIEALTRLIQSLRPDWIEGQKDLPAELIPEALILKHGMDGFIDGLLSMTEE